MTKSPICDNGECSQAITHTYFKNAGAALIQVDQEQKQQHASDFWTTFMYLRAGQLPADSVLSRNQWTPAERRALNDAYHAGCGDGCELSPGDFDLAMQGTPPKRYDPPALIKALFSGLLITPIPEDALFAIGADSGMTAAQEGLGEILARSAIPKGQLSDAQIALAEQHITDSGVTVLGKYDADNPVNGGYVGKARAMNASYFSIGDAWDELVKAGINPWALNEYFLDTRIAAGDRIVLSVSKTEVRPGSYLSDEIRYLRRYGYRWADDATLLSPSSR